MLLTQTSIYPAEEVTQPVRAALGRSAAFLLLAAERSLLARAG